MFQTGNPRERAQRPNLSRSGAPLCLCHLEWWFNHRNSSTLLKCHRRESPNLVGHLVMSESPKAKHLYHGFRIDLLDRQVCTPENHVLYSRIYISRLWQERLEKAPQAVPVQGPYAHEDGCKRLKADPFTLPIFFDLYFHSTKRYLVPHIFCDLNMISTRSDDEW